MGFFDFDNEIMNALSGEQFEERPVDIEEFVTSKDYLGLPPLSELQYKMIRAGSQIYRYETLVELYGEDAAYKRYKETFNEIILQLGKGSLTLDSELYDANTGRWIEMRELQNGDQRVASLDSLGHITDKYSTEVFHSCTAPVYEVTTSKGFKIKVNSTHKFMVPGFELKELVEIGVGGRIGIPTSLPVLNEVPLDEREVKLLGYWLGDGMMPIDEPRRKIINMDFSENDKKAMEEYIDILHSYGDDPQITKSPNKKMWFVRGGIRNSPATLAIAKKYGLWGKRANNKVIPDAVWSLPIDQLRIFISRLWGTDGCVYLKKTKSNVQPVLEYTTISNELAVGIQRLLARLGIIAGLRSRIPTYTYKGEKKNGQRAYCLTISDGEGFLRFHNQISLMDKDTQTGADIYAMRKTRTPYDEDVYWDKIRSIEGVGTENLFSVTEPENSNFVANMILNGNSGK